MIKFMFNCIVTVVFLFVVVPFVLALIADAMLKAREAP